MWAPGAVGAREGSPTADKKKKTEVGDYETMIGHARHNKRVAFSPSWVTLPAFEQQNRGRKVSQTECFHIQTFFVVVVINVHDDGESHSQDIVWMDPLPGIQTFYARNTD